jgi:hypothetical protein
MSVLGAAFLERALTSYVHGPGPFSLASGSVVIALLGAALLAWRSRWLQPVGIRRVRA